MVSTLFGIKADKMLNVRDNNFLFFERIDEDGKFLVNVVTDPDLLQILAKNIKIEE